MIRRGLVAGQYGRNKGYAVSLTAFGVQEARRYSTAMIKPEDCRLDVVEQEQIAAQMISIMDAHFRRPQASEKTYILSLAAQQISAQEASPARPVGLELPE